MLCCAVLAELARFCGDLEKAVIKTVEQGAMTKDLAICVHGTTKVGKSSCKTRWGACGAEGLQRQISAC